MRRFLKWTGIVLGVLVGLLLLAVGVVYLLSNTRINNKFSIAAAPVPVISDPENISNGRHIAVIRGCVDCHGENLEGRVFIDEPVFARLSGSNLTTGSRGVLAKYSDADLVRAIRNGVAPDGRGLLFMPSQEYYVLSDEDIGDLIAYIRSLPPVNNVLPGNAVGPVGRMLLLSGQVPLIPAELIDHEADRPQAPPPGVTAAYGEYLASGCKGCHGLNFSGGPIPGAPPDMLPAKNLTPEKDTGLGNWSEEDFFRALREGIRPDGTLIDPESMPWRLTAQMTDEEIRALWLFFQTLPPRAYGSH